MLKKLFIKNYKDTKDSDVRNHYGTVAGVFAIVSNLFLSVIKIIIGYASGSISIIADAVNNISDVLSGAITIFGFKLSAKKPNKAHPYGFARCEYVSGFIISIIMCVVGVMCVIESIEKIINPIELDISIFTYAIIIVAIIVKFIQMSVYLDFSKAIKSSTLKTTAIDTRNDIISTSTILLSMIIMSIFKINIDGYAGLVVSLFVIISSIKVALDMMNPLIGKVPSQKKINEIKKKLLSYEHVEGIHDLLVHNYGANNDFATVHVEIDSKIDILDSHDIIDTIERDFENDLGIRLTIHLDPVVIGDERIEKLKNEVIEALNKFDETITIHDFRVVEGKKHTNIIFDCVIPYEKDYSVSKIVYYLSNTVKKEDHHYYFIVEIDRPFCS